MITSCRFPHQPPKNPSGVIRGSFSMDVVPYMATIMATN